MYVQADGADRCVTASGNSKADILVVSKSPLGERGKKEIVTYLQRAGFDLNQFAFTGAIKCLVWDLIPGRNDLKACKDYLDAEIEFIRPKWILALGNEALSSTAGKSGIMKHRAAVYTRKDGVKVMATVSPASVYRNPGQKSGFEADLEYFKRLTDGTQADLNLEPTPDQYHVVDDKESIRQMIWRLENAMAVSYDIESNGFDEFKPESRMVSLAATIEWTDPKTAQTFLDVFAVPLWHPESVWRTSWKRVLAILAPYLVKVKHRIAHNGKFDGRWMHEFGIAIDETFDTMLALHLLDENRPKGLKPAARVMLGVEPWAIDTKDLASTPIVEVLWYNALDTWYTFGLRNILREQLLEKPRLAKLFQHIIMPASNTLVHVERRGVWTDKAKLMKHWAIAQSELERVDTQLRAWVPGDHPFKKIKKRRGGAVEVIDGINFNPSNFARWFLFDHLEMPIMERGKDKPDGSPGDPSMKESVLLDLQEQTNHEVINLMLERTKWEKYTSSFFSAYAEQIGDDDRIHTTFKLTGTVTGRLSSGKGDEEKVTAKVQNRGVNMQQVPRDAFVRGIFGAPPSWYFVEFDFSQIELRVAAFLAGERNMLHLYANGIDIHMAMAMRMTGKPASAVTKEERKKAKAVNFGFLYGMGWRKFISTAWSTYGVRVTEEEAKAFRKTFFDEFPLLMKWHAAQRRIAHKHGFVSSPLGRVRHLPDIHSRDKGVAAEAERQAINSPVQSFASDMALWSMVIVDRKFKKMGLQARAIGTVHDAVNYEIPKEELAVALPIIKDVMENLPLQEVFGIDLTVPIVADCKVGTRWGGATEISPESVYDWDDSLLATIG
jgi:DNA polymerase-1